MKAMFLAAVFLTIVAAPSANAQTFSTGAGVFTGGNDDSENFEDCLLTYLPGTGSDAAARMIAIACRIKFSSQSVSASPTDAEGKPSKQEAFAIQEMNELLERHMREGVGK